jgi:hypothetical protein
MKGLPLDDMILTFDDAQAAIKLDFKSTKHFELIISTVF